ncbi:MAG: hypothetical protein ACE5HC_13650 [Candidatus Binatia bacterium]
MSPGDQACPQQLAQRVRINRIDLHLGGRNRNRPGAVGVRELDRGDILHLLQPVIHEAPVPPGLQNSLAGLAEGVEKGLERAEVIGEAGAGPLLALLVEGVHLGVPFVIIYADVQHGGRLLSREVGLLRPTILLEVDLLFHVT